jgi:uncharacterized protein YndB with AHSA1/START domain
MLRDEMSERRVGGGYKLVLTFEKAGRGTGKSSEDTDVVEARFVELVPDERVVEAIEFESDDPRFAGTMTMTWTLTANAGGTEVTVTAADVPEGIDAKDHEVGMSSTLQNLADFVPRSPRVRTS